MWKKGESGNPQGSKSEKQFLAAVKRALAADNGQKLRAAAEKLLDKAAEGEPWAIQQLADRLDGKPGQSIEMNVNRDTRDYSMEELLERLAALRGGDSSRADSPEAGTAKPSELH